MHGEAKAAEVGTTEPSGHGFHTGLDWEYDTTPDAAQGIIRQYSSVEEQEGMETTRVRDIMTSPAIVISPDTPVPAAVALMRDRGIRHLPVVEHERLVGIISRGDLREASISAAINADIYELNFMLHKLTVNKLMSRKVMTVTPDAPVVHAAEMMTEHKIAGLPVVDPSGNVIGIVTESDLLKMLVRKLRQAEDRQANG
jgi:CBS domain-containing protein